jgi:hypothetical protein
MFCGLSNAAACEPSDPVAFAREFYSKHRAFYFKETSGLRSNVAPSLFTALQAHYRCSASGELCHLDYDPWLGAQDGEISGPVSFLPETKKDLSVLVRMRYQFKIDNHPPVPHVVTLQLKRSVSLPCWQLVDLVTPLGDSLAQRYSAQP